MSQLHRSYSLRMNKQ